MKKLISFLLCTLPVIGLAQDKTAVINGTAEYTVPTVIHALYYNKFTQAKSFDSVEVVNGRFSLHVPFSGIAVPVMLVASHHGKAITQADAADSKGLTVYEDGATVHIKESLKKAEITDSRLEKDRENYIKQVYVPAADSAKLGWAINGLSPFHLSLGKAPDSTDTKAYEGYKKALAQKKMMDELTRQKLVLERKFIKENPDSYFCFSAIEDITRYGEDPAEVKPLLNGLSERLRNSPDAQYALTMLAKAEDDKLHPEKVIARREAGRHEVPHLAAGAIAPDFTQPDVNGKAVKLSDFRGKYVLVDFWASWCIPCRAENPNVIRAYEQYKNKNFTVLGIALEEKGKRDAWLAAIKKDKLVWTQLADTEKAENPAAKLFGVTAIPMNFLIDPTGKIIATDLRGDRLQDKLAEILSN